LKKLPVKVQDRPLVIAIVVLLLFSCVCTQIPLLNYLGFEFSALTVLLVGLISGLLTLSLWKRYNAQRESDVWRFLGEISSAQFVLFMIPFLISLANVVFVKNCSIGNGTILYTLIVFPGMVFSISLAMFVGVVFEKWRKTLYTMIYILVLLHISVVTFFRPQIFAFNPIIGFFPGFTHDEALQITQRLLIYRFATLAASGFIFVFAVLVWQFRFRGNKFARESQKSLPMIEISLLALLGPVVLIIFSFSDRLGFSSSEEFIRQKLAGNYKTTHFEILYPAGTIKRERIEQIGYLHEFYFDKLSKELNINNQERTISFIYASPEQKGRLVGAINTDIAKPWLRQMHINLADIEFVLKHEMVHVLAAGFGWSPLKVAPNSGLIEGLAVAMEKTAMEEPLDRAAALAFAAGINPDLESLFTLSGFVKANPGVSYTLAGSFCKSLIDSFGVEKFKDLYRNGDFNAVYPKDLKSLLLIWQNTVKNVPLSKADSAKALFFFKRPSIFGKECARVIANMNKETKEFLENQEFGQALYSAEKSLGLSRTSTSISQKTTALFELKHFQDVVRFIKTQLSDSTLGYALLSLHVRLGDAYWAMDSLIQAKYEYETIASIHLGSWYEEAIPLRLESLRNIQDRNELRNYFIYAMEDTVRIVRLERLYSSVARYLLAREYAVKEHFSESARVYELHEPMQSRALEYFRLRRLGKVWFELQHYEKAKVFFEQSLLIVPTDYLQMETIEWIERCVFMQNNLRKVM
jgi:tetratricopeptide (TPR) repeat protein